jgi:hypothetical protein
MADDGKPATGTERTDSEILAHVRQLIREAGNNHEAAMIKQSRGAFRVRRQRDEAIAELDALKKQLPEGSVVLTGDEAKALKALKEKGVDLTKIGASIERLPALESELATLKDNATFDEIAKELQWNPAPLRRLAKSDNLELSKREAEVTVMKDGKETTEKRSMWHARKRGDDKAPWSSLVTYVEKEAPEMKPALATKAGPNGTGTPATGTVWPLQTPSTGTQRTGAADPIDEFINKANDAGKATNPNRLDIGSSFTSKPVQTAPDQKQ